MKAVIKKLALIAFLATVFMSQKTYTREEGWFQTWDRLEYIQWAAAIPEGYELHIIRVQEENYLVVKAKLLMGTSGLPGFQVVQQVETTDEKEALEQIKVWREEYRVLFAQDCTQEYAPEEEF